MAEQTIVERVARIFARVALRQTSSMVNAEEVENYINLRWPAFAEDACEAILDMHKPTEVMLERMQGLYGAVPPDQFWETIIDTVLAEEEARRLTAAIKN